MKTVDDYLKAAALKLNTVLPTLATDPTFPTIVQMALLLATIDVITYVSSPPVLVMPAAQSAPTLVPTLPGPVPVTDAGAT